VVVIPLVVVACRCAPLLVVQVLVGSLRLGCTHLALHCGVESRAVDRTRDVRPVILSDVRLVLPLRSFVHQVVGGRDVVVPVSLDALDCVISVKAKLLKHLLVHDVV
jgi:hypothetical protein